MKQSTSWQKSSNWYNKTVGTSGHYYHQHVILPRIIELLRLTPSSRLLDIGCGQGVLARAIPKEVEYTGIDNAPSLIQFAQNQDKNPKHIFLVGNATLPLKTPTQLFSHAAAILCLQNMEYPERAIAEVAKKLEKGGIFVIVLNHPAFRIPRQSGWGIGENKLQYRYENIYMSHLKIPISMHPGEKNSEVTWSFHKPISFFIESLSRNGFSLLTMQEWISDKTSAGKAAGMENKARSEFPLFLTLVAQLLR